VLRVPDGFSESFLGGSGDVKLQKTVTSMSANNVSLDLLINRYLGIAGLYLQNAPGMSESEIVENVFRDLDVSSSLDFNNYNRSAERGELSFYFQFIAYPILAILIMGVTSIMMAFNEKDLSNRNLCAPISKANMNFQLLLGNAVFALAVWAALCVMIFILHGGAKLETGLILLMANALIFTVAGLSIAFLAGKFIKGGGSQAAVTNVVSLGISFISGVFVEQELLGRTVLSIASFTPGYWYIKAVNDIRTTVAFTSQAVAPILYSFLIQLGFAAVFFILALVVTKQRKTSLA
jgi:ABC-2 type transport system permease protein